MKTNAKDRAEWEQHYHQFIDGDLLPATTLRILALIADVDDATRLLIAMYNNAPSADEFRLMVRTMGRTTEAAEDLMPQIDRLAEAEVEVAAFIKELNND